MVNFVPITFVNMIVKCFVVFLLLEGLHCSDDIAECNGVDSSECLREEILKLQLDLRPFTSHLPPNTKQYLPFGSLESDWHRLLQLESLLPEGHPLRTQLTRSFLLLVKAVRQALEHQLAQPAVADVVEEEEIMQNDLGNSGEFVNPLEPNPTLQEIAPEVMIPDEEFGIVVASSDSESAEPIDDLREVIAEGLVAQHSTTIKNDDSQPTETASVSSDVQKEEQHEINENVTKVSTTTQHEQDSYNINHEKNEGTSVHETKILESSTVDSVDGHDKNNEAVESEQVVPEMEHQTPETTKPEENAVKNRDVLYSEVPDVPNKEEVPVSDDEIEPTTHINFPSVHQYNVMENIGSGEDSKSVDENMKLKIEEHIEHPKMENEDKSDIQQPDDQNESDDGITEDKLKQEVVGAQIPEDDNTVITDNNSTVITESSLNVALPEPDEEEITQNSHMDPEHLEIKLIPKDNHPKNEDEEDEELIKSMLYPSVHYITTDIAPVDMIKDSIDKNNIKNHEVQDEIQNHEHVLTTESEVKNTHETLYVTTEHSDLTKDNSTKVPRSTVGYSINDLGNPDRDVVTEFNTNTAPIVYSLGTHPYHDVIHNIDLTRNTPGHDEVTEESLYDLESLKYFTPNAVAHEYTPVTNVPTVMYNDKPEINLDDKKLEHEATTETNNQYFVSSTPHVTTSEEIEIENRNIEELKKELMQHKNSPKWAKNALYKYFENKQDYNKIKTKSLDKYSKYDMEISKHTTTERYDDENEEEVPDEDVVEEQSVTLDTVPETEDQDIDTDRIEEIMEYSDGTRDEEPAQELEEAIDGLDLENAEHDYVEEDQDQPVYQDENEEFAVEIPEENDLEETELEEIEPGEEIEPEAETEPEQEIVNHDSEEAAEELDVNKHLIKSLHNSEEQSNYEQGSQNAEELNENKEQHLVNNIQLPVTAPATLPPFPGLQPKPKITIDTLDALNRIIFGANYDPAKHKLPEFTTKRPPAPLMIKPLDTHRYIPLPRFDLKLLHPQTLVLPPPPPLREFVIPASRSSRLAKSAGSDPAVAAQEDELYRWFFSKFKSEDAQNVADKVKRGEELPQFEFRGSKVPYKVGDVYSGNHNE